MELNCKPNSLAMVVRGAVTHGCIARLVGCPVQLGERYYPLGPLGLVLEQAEGPLWLLKEMHRCPLGQPWCTGMEVIPDRCLRPMDPGSEPNVDNPLEAMADLIHEALKGP